ncbi:MAG: TerB family tellurite resistance protein [Acidobacteria bacterium]|nr:TerB family tellurite resistance protein [Acidobacteriota bacterium]
MNLFEILGLSSRLDRTDDLERGSLYEQLENCLSGLPENEIRFVAGLAGLLGRVALADMKLETEEIEEIRRILREESSLTTEQVERVLRLIELHADEYFGAENVYYTRLINQAATKIQKLEVLHAVFAVAAANGSISVQEEAEIRTIASGLLLTHQEYIEIRIQFRDQLDVLR